MPIEEKELKKRRWENKDNKYSFLFLTTPLKLTLTGKKTIYIINVTPAKTGIRNFYNGLFN